MDEQINSYDQHVSFVRYLMERFDGDQEEVTKIVDVAEQIIPNLLHDYFGTSYKSVYDIQEVNDVEDYRRRIKLHPILKNIDISEDPRYTEVLKWYKLFLKASSLNSIPICTPGEMGLQGVLGSSETADGGISNKKIVTIYLEGEEGESQPKVYRERNRQLRQTCINYYKSKHGGRIICECCGFDFAKTYDINDEYIEIHHLLPFSQTEGEHPVDAVKDLVPLCANCHRMIHHGMGGNGNCMSLEDLKKIYKGNIKYE